MATPKGAAVKFGTPPPRKQSPYDWNSIASKLRKRPGDWALIFEGDKTSLVTAIRLDGIKALRADKGFEVRTANNIKGSPRTCDLWMRYEPTKDKENN